VLYYRKVQKYPHHDEVLKWWLSNDFRFDSVFIYKKKQLNWILKKNKTEPKPVQTGRFRFDSVFYDKNRFKPVWLGFFGLALSFPVWLQFGFFIFRLIKPKPNQTGWFFQIFNRFNQFFSRFGFFGYFFLIFLLTSNYLLLFIWIFFLMNKLCVILLNLGKNRNTPFIIRWLIAKKVKIGG